MKKYKIGITEILRRVITVEAENLDQAIYKVIEDYDKRNIVLDSNDFMDVEFNEI